jgi:hypothetical protein
VPCARCRLFGVEADVPVGAARIALARGAAVVVGTPDRDRIIRIGRVTTIDLPAGRAGEQALVDRLAAELSARIAAFPEAWLGLFVPARIQGTRAAALPPPSPGVDTERDAALQRREECR